MGARTVAMTRRLVPNTPVNSMFQTCCECERATVKRSRDTNTAQKLTVKGEVKAATEIAVREHDDNLSVRSSTLILQFVIWDR